MSHYAPYPAYKDSGVEWLGRVPEGWGLKRLKYVCRIRTGDKDTVDAVDDGQFPFYVRAQTIERINSYTADCEAVLTAGDGVGVGKVFHYVLGKFDFHQRVYMLHDFRLVSGRFLYYHLLANFHKVALDGGAKSTVDSLRLHVFLNFMFAVPNQREQRTILAHLDREMARLDELVAKKTRFIELLREKRQALITHAVTKGLDPTVKMNDSGVEWLGDVPEHWVICLMKRRCLLITDGAHVSPEIENGTHYFVSTKDVSADGIDFDNCLLTSSASYDYLVRSGCKPDSGDVLFSKDGTIGRTIVVDTDVEFVVASSLIIIRPMPSQLLPKYLDYLCTSTSVAAQVESLVRGAGLPRISIQNLLKIVCAFPPLREQKEVVMKLNCQTARLDTLIEKTERSIALIKERRAALITAAVTGQIDLRAAA